MTVNLLSESWERSATGQVTRELRQSRIRFYRHPLYIRWTRDAFGSRLALLADAIPDWLVNIVPTLMVFLPVTALVIAILFGVQTFTAVMSIFALMVVGLAVGVGTVGTPITAGVAAAALVGEQRSGRWEMIMMMPYDRTHVMVMRLSSMIYPYRTLITSIDLLQTFFALVVAMYLSGSASSTDSILVGTCVIFAVPSLILLSWERRQDFALSVAIGAWAGLFGREQSTKIAVTTGTGLILVSRAIIGLLAIGFAPNAHGFALMLPIFIAGPAMLPMMGIALEWAIPLLLLYYGGREIAIHRVWRRSLNQVWG